ncbi:integral membrane protein S linking to the trans Golgi network-domain-containing protein [Ochromonadaceae sp. CCMP2298]|nr:integral membrane protein S linking to the trans Golgi network-domain-containing protein [Ochromonadaceae sp. CCMP2298]|mmetsp:Transcript_6446/g.14238  ORF Transcript_6446/g.14238 Transcript_6446/m.14238 type:complete len:145 (+) Transcript_6446:100-534(+)|eukprot:CAMPEP_0173202892 /NCGR_PEP_ID=MMETSP1141-20130122/19223_1 /TAXON_ID=483371 /ORGANISM="non described non described, Strain CCMP2298" /LENGTH=144 /DNA_ID=CAMNT_0014128303 /DNA_START=22 /DNA_END=456 /DNA_ORIENTATION=-
MSFDPVLITYQIVSLQCFHYLAMGTLLGVFHAIFDLNVSLDHFFTPRFVNFVSVAGWIETLAILLSGLAGAYLLSLIVEKAKKCVDFTFTLYFIHIVICCFYYELPLEWEWWLVHVVASVAMASLGEYLCSRAELEDIPLYTPN